MVKKKVSKSKKVSNKKIMKKGSSKSNLTYAVIAVLVLCALCLNFVEVGQGFSFTGNAVITGNAIGNNQGFLEQMFTSWTSGDFDVNIAKYLFFVMLIILIFSILSSANFPTQNSLKWLLAVPIAFLFVAYITPAEMFSVLTLYTTAGIVLTSVVPFMVLLFFSAMLLTPQQQGSSNRRRISLSPSKILLQIVLWVTFLAVLLVKLISGIVNDDISFGLNITFVVMAVITFVTFLILFMNKKFRNWIVDIGFDLRRLEHEIEVRNAIEDRNLADMMRGVNANPTVTGAGASAGP